MGGNIELNLSNNIFQIETFYFYGIEIIPEHGLYKILKHSLKGNGIENF